MQVQPVRIEADDDVRLVPADQRHQRFANRVRRRIRQLAIFVAEQVDVLDPDDPAGLAQLALTEFLDVLGPADWRIAQLAALAEGRRDQHRSPTVRQTLHRQPRPGEALVIGMGVAEQDGSGHLCGSASADPEEIDRGTRPHSFRPASAIGR